MHANFHRGLAVLMMGTLVAAAPATGPADKAVPAFNLGVNPLTGIVDTLAEKAGASVYVDWQSVEAAGVQRDGRREWKSDNTGLTAQLKKLFEEQGADQKKVTVATIDGVVFVGSPAAVELFSKAVAAHAKADHPPRPKLGIDRRTRAIDRPLAMVQFDHTGLGDVLDFLKDASGIGVTADWEAMAVAKIDKTTPVSLRAKDLKCSTVVLLVLLQARNDGATLDYKLTDGKIEVTAVPVETAADKTGK